MNHLVIAKELKSRDVTYKTVYDLLGKELNLLFDDYNRLAYNRISTDPKVKSTPTGTCKPFELRLFFTVDGYLMPCEHIEFKYKFGECTKNNVKIFENEIVKFYNAAYANINKQCRSCYYSNLCSECLFNMEVINDKFICNKYLDLRGFTKLLSATIENLELKHDTVDFVIEDITLK
jgi:radical SAM protein with 4Fe4S-binding SPASM domain